MKKILIVLAVAAAMAVCPACKKNTDKNASVTDTAVSTAKPQSTSAAGTAEQNTASDEASQAAATEIPRANAENYADENTDGKLNRLAPPEEVPEIKEDTKERDFSGVWRATSTTSETSNFESMTVEIHYSGYSVSMTFSDQLSNIEYEGTYKIKDGVLIFDKNFQDCKAYFYDDEYDTLVLDNGTSLVYCTRVSEEEQQ